MSSDPRKPIDTELKPDQDLQAFLRGEDAISRAYANTQTVQPPADLDAAVLDFAHRNARSTQTRHRLRRWQRPLALAAVLALSMSVLLQLWKEPQVRDPIAAYEQAASSSVEMAPAPSASPAEAEQGIAPTPQAAATDTEITARKQARNAEAASKPAQAAPSPPPPPAASMAPEPDNTLRSAPIVASAAAPAAVAESRSMPSLAMEAPAADVIVDSVAESASGAAPRDEVQRQRRPAPAIAAEAMQGGAMIERKAETATTAGKEITTQPQAFASKKQPGKTPVWQAAVFDTLQIGQATQAQVRARYGAGRSQGIATSAADERLREHYDSLPGQTGSFEFEYERGSLRLLAVRQRLPAGVRPEHLLAQLGWNDDAQIRDGESPPCGASGMAETAASYWLFPARGAYLVLSSRDSVEQLVYTAACN